MSSSAINLSEFNEKRAWLLNLLDECQDLLNQLELVEWCSTLNELKNRLNSEAFRLLIIGEFKRGKSTFINALIGEEVLPAFPTPCTAIINELKWGDSPKAILHFKTPLPSPLPNTLDAEARQHLDRHRGEQVPPMTINAVELERYVVIPQTGQSENDEQTPYDYAEVFWPLDLLRNSVEIIDSPGLNEHASRSKITMDYIGQVDAVLFVLSVHALASQTELSVVDNNIVSAGHNEIFFVCNRYDELRKQSDRDKVVHHANEQLANRTAFGREGVFFTSAIDAVIGREENDSAAVDRSGIIPLERALSNFLVNERGRIKLLRPARQLNAAVRSALNETIPSQQKMLESDMADFQKRYDQAQPQLRKAMKNRDQVVRKLEKVANRMWESVNDAALLHLRLLNDEIPFWAEQVELQNNINVLKMWTLDAQIKTVTTEVVEGVAHLAEQNTATWQETRLKPLIEDHMEDLAEAVETQVEDFMNEIKGIREQLTGVSSALVQGESVGAAERVLSGIGGLVLGGAGSAIEGAIGGYDGMLRSLLPQIAVAVGAIVVFHLNPITVVPALIGLGIFRSLRKGDALASKVRRQIGDEMSRLLGANSGEIAAEISNQVQIRCHEQIERIQATLDREIMTVQEEVEAIYKAKKAGEAATKSKLHELKIIEAKIKRIDDLIDGFSQQYLSE